MCLAVIIPCGYQPTFCTMVKKKRNPNYIRPHGDISKLFRPSTIPYVIAAVACLYVSSTFAARIGQPNERVQRRKAIADKRKNKNTGKDGATTNE